MPPKDALDTRDIAVEAQTLIKAHVLDCVEFRKTLIDIHREFRDDLKKINWRMAMILGGVVVLSHGLDWFLRLSGH